MRLKQIAWFVGLCIAGVATLSVFAFIIRWGLGL